MTPDEIRLINLRDLTEVYRDGTAAYWGDRLILGRFPLWPWLFALSGPFERLLGRSSYRTGLATNATRTLLRFYGLLEVASLVRAIPTQLPTQFVNTSLRHLRNPLVQQVQDGDLPMILPQLFRFRLERRQGQLLLEENPTDNQPGRNTRLFQHLIGLYGAATSDSEIYTFLGTIRSENPEQLHYLQSSMKSQAGFLNLLTASHYGQGGRMSLLNGFRKFLLYCLDMHRLYSESRDIPLFLAALRWFHFDWLSEYSALALTVRTGLQRFREWQPSQEGEEANRFNAAVDRLRISVDDILSLPDVPEAWRSSLTERFRPG